MAETIDGNGLKVIAFYLPQFHTIPENDQWWGEGFTEWTNVKKAIPLFEGHNQPRVPLNENYYDLMDDEVKIKQAELAKKYGIYGFCYYHYWFKNGEKLLEKPAEQMLQNKDVDLPFCFSWANENWSRNWDGGNQEIIKEQDYGDKDDWEEHFQYLLPFFRDERYITVNGKPLLIIYKPDEIIDVYQMISYWRKRSVEEGFPGLCMAFQFPTYYADLFYRKDVFDYRIGFEPVYCRNLKRMDHPARSIKVSLARMILGENYISSYRNKHKPTQVQNVSKSKKLEKYDYDEAWNNILSADWTPEFLPGAFVEWDNTPRNKNGLVYVGFTVDKFRAYLKVLLKKAKSKNKPMVFINAWNEWAEGAYLEPDELTGTGKLEALKQALDYQKGEL